MPKVSAITVIYNNKKWIKLVFDSILAQTHKDLEVFAVICGNEDGSKEFLQANYPSVKILDPGRNLGFAAGNNLAIREASGEFIQLVNPDLILEPNFIDEMLKAFADPQVAAASGKLLRFDFAKQEKTKVVDSLGITMSVSGRARDIAQNQIDEGQFEARQEIFGVSGAGVMYRKSALEQIKYEQEYFDENFLAYWEDVDLSWRLNNKGFKQVYIPTAVGFHGRAAGQAEGGYLHLFKFIKHHSNLSKQVLRLNYKNHILMYLKNAKFIHPLFILREIAMLGYILVFETATLKVIPELIRQIPLTFKKR
jgi:GT2 family glycosyltransferase